MKDSEIPYIPGKRYLVVINRCTGKQIMTDRFSSRQAANKCKDKYERLAGISARVIDTIHNKKGGQSIDNTTNGRE